MPPALIAVSSSRILEPFPRDTSSLVASLATRSRSSLGRRKDSSLAPLIPERFFLAIQEKGKICYYTRGKFFDSVRGIVNIVQFEDKKG